MSEQEEEEGWYNGLQQRRQTFQTQFQQGVCISMFAAAVRLSIHQISGILTAEHRATLLAIREHFSDLRDTFCQDRYLSWEITGVVTVSGIGTVSFRRENLPPISFTDVLFIPGMKKNLILVSTLQDRGFEVSFRGTKVLIYPRGALYRLRTE